jgi:hypothetical protein
MSFSIQEPAQCHKPQEIKSSRFPSDKFKKVFRETPPHEKKRDAQKKQPTDTETAPLPAQTVISAAPIPSSLMLGAVSESLSSGSIQPLTLPAEIEALFEKMAGTLILACSSLETETSLILDSPQFSSSPFYGTQISIKEFSTAPKAFNIEILSSATALALLAPHQADLLAFFEKGNFNFSIGRLTTSIQDSDRPLFHRKESVSQEDDSKDRESQQ